MIKTHEQQFRGQPLQTREHKTNQGAIRTWYRYGTSGRWYRSLVSAQIAAQGGRVR